MYGFKTKHSTDYWDSVALITGLLFAVSVILTLLFADKYPFIALIMLGTLLLTIGLFNISKAREVVQGDFKEEQANWLASGVYLNFIVYIEYAIIMSFSRLIARLFLGIWKLIFS